MNETTSWSTIQQNWQVDGNMHKSGLPITGRTDYSTGLVPKDIIFAVRIQSASRSPWPIANTRHAPSCCCYWNCGFGEIGNPGIIWIISYHVLCHLLEHGTSSMGTHSLARCTLLWYTNQQCWKLLNWLVQPSIKQLWRYWKDNEVEELQ